MLTSGLDKIRRFMQVLEAQGIEFLNHGNPGSLGCGRTDK